MDHLWSPWRMDYIKNKENSTSCVFCDVLEMQDGLDNLIIKRGKSAYVILNRYPYNTGHSLVIPFRHVESYESLEPQERFEIMELINQTTTVLRIVYQPEGFNVGANVGKAAGAGIAPHFHFHIRPRWCGDSNFITTVGHTRIVPEDLCDTFSRVKNVWESTFPES